MNINAVIESTGCYIPGEVVKNEDFLDREFLTKTGQPFPKSNAAIVEKLGEITAIEERRYEVKGNTRHMASEAGRAAMQATDFDPETLDGIIVAHNFGDIQPNESQGHLIPNLAAKVKHDLGIRNSRCFAFDVLFGCPGWLLAMDQANQYIQNGAARAILVVGVESLSRVVDTSDVDSMLFGDGAGAALLVAEESEDIRGIIGYDSFSDCGEELEFLRMESPIASEEDRLCISMTGRCVFKYAVNSLPEIITSSLNELSIPIENVSQFLFHQANGKMIEAIGRKLMELNGDVPIMDKVPVIIQKLGNTSVATIPTLLDLILNNKLDKHRVGEGEIVVMASVGAGMHANCLVYKF